MLTISIILLGWLLAIFIPVLLLSLKEFLSMPSNLMLSPEEDLQRLQAVERPSKNLVINTSQKEKKMRGEYKMFRFNRGEKYSCIVTIINGEQCVFSDLKYPTTASKEVVAEMLNEAEEAAMKKYTEGLEEFFAGY